MNTKILLAIAGAAALSACTTNKAEIVAMRAVPVEPENRTAVAKPSPARIPAGDPGFRVPDPTDDLYPLRKTATTSRLPAYRPVDPLSTIPATPPPRPVATPESGASSGPPLAPIAGTDPAPATAAASSD